MTDTYAGTIALTRNLVGGVTSGSVALVSQDVQLNQTYSGSIGTVTNEISGTTSGRIALICNRVLNRATPSFFKRNGWDVNITIGNTEITASELYGELIINKAENESNTCEFTVLVTNPVAFIDAVYDGTQQVIIDYFDGTTVNRLVTALVDSPDIDLINRRVKLKCSNQREELIEANMTASVKTVGRYSLPVQGEFNSVKAELDLRLKSTPYSVNFDSFNNTNINYWYTTTPDYTLTNANVYYRAPSVDWQNRGDIINTVKIDLQYKRTRLYHVERAFSWTAPYVGDPADFLFNLYTSPDITMVDSAIKEAGWKQIGNVTYQAVYRAAYDWFGKPYAVTVTPVLDDNGTAILDAAGNILFNKTPATGAETPVVNVMSANWTAARQFSQFLTEKYQLTVQAPQSITKNGTVVEYNDYIYEDAYDDTEWDAYSKTQPVPAGAVTSGSNYYVDLAETTPGQLNGAILTALDIGRTSILATHRNTRVTFETLLMPTLELRHTVELDTDLITCTGRVVRIMHTLDMMDGERKTEVSLALFRCPGTTTETARVAPARPTYSPTITGSTVVLGNHYGQLPATTPGSDAWNGFIGNKAIHFTAGFFNTPYTVRGEFTDEFRVDTPAIPDSLRAMQMLPVSATYNVLIPNDNLEIDLSW